MSKNIEINININGGYEILYPKTIVDNVSNAVSINTMNTTINNRLQNFKIRYIEYNGTGGSKGTSSNPMTLTFQFTPKVVIIGNYVEVGSGGPWIKYSSLIRIAPFSSNQAIFWNYNQGNSNYHCVVFNSGAFDTTAVCITGKIFFKNNMISFYVYDSAKKADGTTVQIDDEQRAYACYNVENENYQVVYADF